MTKKDAKDAARLIAADLFTDGGSRLKAKRLVMQLEDGTFGAGWAEKPMADRIEEWLLKFK